MRAMGVGDSVRHVWNRRTGTAYVRSRTDMLAASPHTNAVLMEDWSLQRFTATKCEPKHGHDIPITPDFLAAHGGWTHRDTHAVRVRDHAPGPDRKSTRGPP